MSCTKVLKTAGKFANAGLLRHLLRDKSGASAIMIAASMVPIAGVIGGGLDMGRAYLAKSKLQAACDAGALAGRRTMTGNVWSSTSQTAANSYFGVNFVSGKYGTTGLTRTFASADGQSVTGTASVSVPTTLMKIFGYSTVPLNVTCEAVMNLPNTDIMFVLDTTGSMNEAPDGTTPTVANPSKISGLRASVTNFYTTMRDAAPAGIQVRYGFVPYSSSVNVGRLLLAENSNWLVDRWTYQSRRPDGTTTGNNAAQTNVVNGWNDNWVQMSGPASRTTATSPLPAENCVAPAYTLIWSPTVNISTSTIANAASKNGLQTITVQESTGNGTYYSVSNSGGNCTLTAVTYINYVERWNYNTIIQDVAASTSTFYNWSYRPIEYDVSPLKSGGSIIAPIGADHANRTVSWSGCIEERDTARSLTYNVSGPGNIAPGSAFDMDIDRIPNNDNTRWRPALPHLVFARGGLDSGWSVAQIDGTNSEFANLGDTGGDYSSCPTTSKKLSTIDSATGVFNDGSGQSITNYLNSLAPSGLTYHDIGLTWGARLMSPTGLFAAENATTPTGQEITRHMIFMTDGETFTKPGVYDAYGFPGIDRRRVMDPNQVPTKADQDSLVATRTEALCSAIKAKGITVWVIAFGTSLDSMLTNCASAPANAFQANDSVALNNTFANIASNIANLRLKR